MRGPFGQLIPPLPETAQQGLDRPDPIGHQRILTASSRSASEARRVEVTRPTLLVPHFDTVASPDIDKLSMWYSPISPIEGDGANDLYGVPAPRNVLLLSPGRWWVLIYAEINLVPATPFYLDFLELDARIPGLVDRFYSSAPHTPSSSQVKAVQQVASGTPVRIIKWRELILATSVRVQNTIGGSGAIGLRWGALPAANRFILVDLGDEIVFREDQIPAEASLWAITLTGVNNFVSATIDRQ